MKECRICGVRFPDDLMECPGCGRSLFRQIREGPPPEQGCTLRSNPATNDQATTPISRMPRLIQYEATVIHAGEDSLRAAEIVTGLKDRGILVYVDPVSMAKNFTVGTAVIQAVLDSRVLVYVCSHATRSSLWCNVENVEFLRTLPRNRSLHVLSVLIDDTAMPPGLEAYKCFDLVRRGSEEQLDMLAGEIKRLLRRRSIFVTYSARDKAEVRRIVKSLGESPDYHVWFDEKELPAGSILRRGIERGIAEADYLLAIVSQNTLDSAKGWIGFELDQAYQRERERNLADHYFLIPVLIEPDLSLSGWLDTKVYVDLTKGFEEGMQRIREAVSRLSPVA